MDKQYAHLPTRKRNQSKAVFSRLLVFMLFTLASLSSAFAQTTPQSSSAVAAPVYPRMAGYLGVLHPLITWNETGTETNFDRYYVVGFPNKIVRKGPTNRYFVAVPLPVRFGNDRSASFTVGFQFGIVF